MFEPSQTARIFGCAPGVDFSKALVDGIITRQMDGRPEQLARILILVNTRRMQRRIVELFDQGPARLLPKIRLITDLANDPLCDNLPAAVSPLRRRLELSQLISKLLDKQPGLAPRSALFDLADSLALLLAEMQDEAVSPDKIFNLDVSDTSGHWQRSQKFLEIVAKYFGTKSTEPPDQETRQRRAVEQLTKSWAMKPPIHPVIVAGSTGSRGSTALLMQAVAKLPQGALILPGFDFDLPSAVWDHLDNALLAEGHPQFRLRRIFKTAGLDAKDVVPWLANLNPPSPARNRLVSLALRPAPVTNQWLCEGPDLVGINGVAIDMALIEAPSERIEAVSIALALRKAAETGKTAALVTPDRLLTRRVRAALDRWHIEPDASVGDSLDHSAPGRLLRHVAELFGVAITAEALLIILKHPLVNIGTGDRARHLHMTRELELSFRKNGPPQPNATDLKKWAETGDNTLKRKDWTDWLTETLLGLQGIGARSIGCHLDHHLSIVSTLAAGPSGKDVAGLWDQPAGVEAQKVVSELEAEAKFGGLLSPHDYQNLLHAILARGEVRDPVRPHPNIMIWGTLEARVQGADLVILGGLNEGTWPEHTTPDPWLNRELRHKAGLLLPERRIGLSAHDFQQAIAAKQVILSRAIRSADAQTVPSRWLNRLTNLMQGMSEAGAVAARQIRDNGQHWLDLAHSLENPASVPAASRPAPVPPVDTRPKQLSVTAISRLIRDPYAIYARHILRLMPLDALNQSPDAPLRGTIMHRIFEQFIGNPKFGDDPVENKAQLMTIAAQILHQDAPWPVARLLWYAKLERIADEFLAGETLRRKNGSVAALECTGALLFDDISFTLTAKADRVDQSKNGLLIYDYKTGQPPSETQQRYFDKQLLLEAVMAQNGGFDNIDPAPVHVIGHIGVGTKPKFETTVLTPDEIQATRKGFVKLIRAYQGPTQGYTSRRAMAAVRFDGDYDHLARYGEWDDTQMPVAIQVGV